MYPQELPFVLGAEVCGTVEAVGDGVTAPRLGDRVTTADAVGAYAEYALRQPTSSRRCRTVSPPTSPPQRS